MVLIWHSALDKLAGHLSLTLLALNRQQDTVLKGKEKNYST